MPEYECDGTLDFGFSFTSLDKPIKASAIKKKILKVLEEELEIDNICEYSVYCENVTLEYEKVEE